MRLSDDSLAQHVAAAAAAATTAAASTLSGIWALILLHDIGWKSPWKSSLWVASVFVCVFVSNRGGRVLIYALQGAAVPSDDGLGPRQQFRCLFTMVTHPLEARAEKIHTYTSSSIFSIHLAGSLVGKSLYIEVGTFWTLSQSSWSRLLRLVQSDLAESGVLLEWRTTVFACQIQKKIQFSSLVLVFTAASMLISLASTSLKTSTLGFFMQSGGIFGKWLESKFRIKLNWDKAFCWFLVDDFWVDLLEMYYNVWSIFHGTQYQNI